MRTDRVWHSGIVAHRARVVGISLLVSVMAMASLAVAYTQSLTWIPPIGRSECRATGISADGKVVVGFSYVPSGVIHAFRWTRQGGVQDLGTLGGSESEAKAVSSDGRTIVGRAKNSAGRFRAFIWTEQNGMQELPDLDIPDNPPYLSTALGISDSGIVVGATKRMYGSLIAVRWTANGAEALSRGIAHDISLDGSTVVGGLQSGSSYHPFRWTAQDGMQDLASTGGYGMAFGVSSDGNVVVGYLQNRAFRWVATSNGGRMEDLGVLPGGAVSYAYDVSADGKVVVGEARDSSGNMHAFRWTEERGIEDLNISYAHLLPPNSILITAEAISSDGRYIVGEGYNSSTRRFEAFLLDTCVPHNGDVDNNGCVDDADLLAVLFAFGGTSKLDRADINCDGVVDDVDLLTMLFNFGAGCN